MEWNRTWKKTAQERHYILAQHCSPIVTWNYLLYPQCQNRIRRASVECFSACLILNIYTNLFQNYYHWHTALQDCNAINTMRHRQYTSKLIGVYLPTNRWTAYQRQVSQTSDETIHKIFFVDNTHPVGLPTGYANSTKTHWRNQLFTMLQLHKYTISNTTLQALGKIW